MDIGSKDPLDEANYSPVKGLIHKYKNRVVLLIAEHCATSCDYCTRKGRLGEDYCLTKPVDKDRALNYIRATPSITDVILSGGDPLSLSNDAINTWLVALCAIPGLRVFRLHTRYPVQSPKRIDPQLVNLLKNIPSLWLGLHINHPDELSSELCKKISELRRAGIPMYSQTVLLKGINNKTSLLKALFEKLVETGIKPYYLYQCDNHIDLKHYRVSPYSARKLYRSLHDLSGLALPLLIFDSPGQKKRAII